MTRACETPASAPFHLMAKPSGPACNLDCSYCFYLDRDALFDTRGTRRMSAEVLDAYVRQTIAATPAGAPVEFTWQGDEPTLLGIDFYVRALELQRRYGPGRQITNAFQTNGTLIDDNWAAFLAEQGFLVGLSLDGPAHVHDRWRRHANGKPTHAQVMAALERLQRAGAACNVLACVDAHSQHHAEEVYRFLTGAGVEFIQFTPVLERLAGASDKAQGFDLARAKADDGARLAPYSVSPLGWGRFLTQVFELWRRADVGRVFVMNFEWTLASIVGAPGTVCHHLPECGRALIVEHDGAVYNCDHFAWPEYRLGTLGRDSLAAMVDSTRAREFGRSKRTTLPGQCRRCPHLSLCWGGCPKHRFAQSFDGEPGLNHLCAGYAHYFGHVTPWLSTLGRLLAAGRDASEIMNHSPREHTHVA